MSGYQRNGRGNTLIPQKQWIVLMLRR